MSVALLIDFVNITAFIIFLVLVGAIIFSMVRRLVIYRTAELPVPTLLKRGFVLFGALALLGFEAAILRIFGGDLLNDEVVHLAYIVQSDIVMLGALGYYAKAEIFDVDDPDKP
jgi:hypothetical protein